MRHGHAIANATVALKQGFSWVRVTSNAEGRFEIPDLRFGDYFVIAMAPDRDAKGIHTLKISSDHAIADLELDDEATIAGQVVDESDQPVAGVVVRSGQRSQVDDGALESTTDATGRFTIRALHDMTYWVAVKGWPAGVSMQEPATLFNQPPEGVKVTVKTKTEHMTGVKLVVRRIAPKAP